MPKFGLGKTQSGQGEEDDGESVEMHVCDSEYRGSRKRNEHDNDRLALFKPGDGGDLCIRSKLANINKVVVTDVPVTTLLDNFRPE